MTSYAAETLDFSRIKVDDIIPKLDFDTTLQAFVTAFQKYWQEERDADPDLPPYDVVDIKADPVMRVGRAGALIRLFERASYDDRIRNLLLGSAVGVALDLVGTTYYGVERMIVPAVAATSTTAAVPEIRERDDRYRKRLQVAPEAGLPRAQRRGAKLGCAKTLGGYVFHAMSCDLRVREADSASLYRGNISVAVLAEDGEDADAVAASVRAWLFREDVKGGTDILDVQPATIVTVPVVATLFAPYGPDAGALTSASETSFRTFMTTRNTFRAPLYGEAIDARLLVPGLENVVRTVPAEDVAAPFGTVLRPGAVSLTVQRLGTSYA